eukprot:CAMPEP_0205808322 /NCGR_PEP_ID=MMETSP0205-20121125/12239_1 /ASSEMBLY_ACC=CAM_ASM_000278 /TAXON_ID=36767 /ORGANISM="Euplotes focardii, Strain TN1" /LENGTH=97 /DNA_ID=CAMNT_0053083811 /DNA_START=217 /DNA_END=507 /DNA_ORIENTATION=+
MESECDLVILDGYPRNQENVDEFEKQLGEIEIIKLIYINVSDDILKERILNRAKLESRDNYDSDIEIVNKRIQSFKDDTCPVIEQYREQGIVVEING